MRRKDRETNKEDAYAILAQSDYGILSLIDGDRPYGVPLSFVLIDNDIYFHCAADGRKVDCLNANAEVSFCAVAAQKAYPTANSASVAYRSAIVEGRAYLVEDNAKKTSVMQALCDKYVGAGTVDAAASMGDYAALVWRIGITSISGKENKG